MAVGGGGLWCFGDSELLCLIYGYGLKMGVCVFDYVVAGFYYLSNCDLD